MRRLLTGFLAALLVAYPCARLAAHVRLIHPTSGAALRWSSPASVGIVIQQDGSDDLLDGSHGAAVRLAIQEWNSVSGTTATLVEDASPSSCARTDWEADDVHLVLFDETNDSGFFPELSSTVALTPVWFFGNGLIQDADVLFNGAGFGFTTSGAGGRFDVADVAAHELGHLLGLDHTGASGGTMYPYVDPALVLHRSLSQDELAGLRDAYPAGAYGRITGTVERFEDGTGVAGAYVVARDSGGRTRASILADPSGRFTLRGLEPALYTVYARPLDGTVFEGNLGSFWSGKIDTDFEPALYPTSATLGGASTVDLGPLQVRGDVSLSLGTLVDTLPVRAIAGATRTVVLHGSGLFVGSTLEAGDSDLLLGVPVWTGTRVSFSLTVPADEAHGEVDLTVTNSTGRIAILPAAFEITPPSPQVLAVVPGQGSASGGDALTLTGAGFALGARVVIGDRIYTDGIDATVVDPSTITLTTAATGPGRHDVVVIDPSGVEGRLAAGLQVLSTPTIDNALPHAGNAGGGTTVLLVGEGFEPGMTVRVDGIDQGPATVEGPTRASFTTVGGDTGGPYTLELVNPDGASTSFAFSYVSQNDPTVTAVTPVRASAGSRITLTGSGFTPTMGVSFYTDAAGSPVPAARVTFVDASTLEVTTPSHSTGVASLLVADLSGCGAFAENVFTFTSGGGGGGGCSIASVEGPGTPRRWLEGGWWVLAVLSFLGLRSIRARRYATAA